MAGEGTETGGGGDAGGMEREFDYIQFAIARLEYWGGFRGVKNIDELIEQLHKMIKNGEVDASNVFKSALDLVDKASKQENADQTERLAKAKDFVEITVNSVAGMSVTDEVRDTVAQRLEEAYDDVFDILNKHPSDLTMTEVEQIESASLTEVLMEQLDDQQVEDLLNSSRDINNAIVEKVKEDPRVEDVYDNIKEIPVIDRTKDPEQFREMKETFAKALDQDMRTLERDGIEQDRVFSLSNDFAVKAAQSVLGVMNPHIAGTVGFPVLSQVLANPTGTPDFNPNETHNIQDCASDMRMTEAEVKETSSEKLISTQMENAKDHTADMAQSDKAQDRLEDSVNKAIDNFEDNAKKAADKKEAAQDAAGDAMEARGGNTAPAA